VVDGTEGPGNNVSPGSAPPASPAPTAAVRADWRRAQTEHWTVSKELEDLARSIRRSAPQHVLKFHRLWARKVPSAAPETDDSKGKGRGTGKEHGVPAKKEVVEKDASHDGAGGGDSSPTPSRRGGGEGGGGSLPPGAKTPKGKRSREQIDPATRLMRRETEATMGPCSPVPASPGRWEGTVRLHGGSVEAVCASEVRPSTCIVTLGADGLHRRCGVTSAEGLDLAATPFAGAGGSAAAGAAAAVAGVDVMSTTGRGYPTACAPLGGQDFLLVGSSAGDVCLVRLGRGAAASMLEEGVHSGRVLACAAPRTVVMRQKGEEAESDAAGAGAGAGAGDRMRRLSSLRAVRKAAE